jgi:hypothetical protein
MAMLFYKLRKQLVLKIFSAKNAMQLSFLFVVFHAQAQSAFISKTPIKVDGLLEEAWLYPRSWVPIYSINNTVSGINNNMVAWGAFWDTQYLYIGVRVRDYALYQDSPYSSFDDDGIEIYIDGDNRKADYYDANDRYFFKKFNNAPLQEKFYKTQGVLHAASLYYNEGYIVELGIPWSSLGVHPSVGLKIGFDIGNNDDDNGGVRDGQLMYYGTGNNWLYPSGFGTLTLAGTPMYREVGEETFSEADAWTSLSVFPNPGKDEVTLQYFSSGPEALEIVVTDMLAQVKYHQVIHAPAGENNMAMHLNDFPPGMYILSIKQNGKISNTRFGCSQ